MFTQMYIEDYFSGGDVQALARIASRVVFLLKWIKIAPRGTRRSVSFSLYDLVNEGIFDAMPRTKRTPAQSSTGTTPQQGQKQMGDISWINIKLDDTDIAYLSEQPIQPEHLGAMLLEVAVRGFNFTVKRMDDGVTYCCSITGKHAVRNDLALGVSAFAAEPCDAALACLYKFEQKLGGEFSSDPSGYVVPTSRFR